MVDGLAASKADKCCLCVGGGGVGAWDRCENMRGSWAGGGGLAMVRRHRFVNVGSCQPCARRNKMGQVGYWILIY